MLDNEIQYKVDENLSEQNTENQIYQDNLLEIDREDEFELENENKTEDNAVLLNETAKLFGQTDSELEVEFKQFKAQKLLSKVNFNLLSSTFDQSTLKLNIENAIKYRFSSVLIFSTFIYEAKKLLANTGILVSSIVGYPFGQENENAIYFNLRKILADKPSQVYVVLPLHHIKNNRMQIVSRIMKKCKRICKKTPIKVVIEGYMLENEHLTKLNSLMRKYKITSLVSSVFSTATDNHSQLAEKLRKAFDDNITIEIEGEIDTTQDLIATFEIADTMLIGNASQISEKLKRRISD